MHYDIQVADVGGLEQALFDKQIDQLQDHVLAALAVCAASQEDLAAAGAQRLQNAADTAERPATADAMNTYADPLAPRPCSRSNAACLGEAGSHGDTPEPAVELVLAQDTFISWLLGHARLKRLALRALVDLLQDAR